MSVVPLSELGKCATAANVAAIIAAAVAPLATTVGLAAAVAPLATTVGLAAAVAPLATTAGLAAAVAPLATAAALAASEAALDASIASVAAQVQALAVGATLLHTSVTISGIATSGTVLAAPGVGLTITIVAVACSCGAFNTIFNLASVGGTTMGVHQILIGDNFTLSIPFGYVLRGGSNASVTANKTASAIIDVDVWYWIG